MLPGIDGLEVCRRLREAGDVPVIMLTALGGEVDRVVGSRARGRRLRHQAVQPPRARAPGRLGAAAGGRAAAARRAPERRRPCCRQRPARRDPGGRAALADRPRVRPAAASSSRTLARPTPATSCWRRCGAGRSATSRRSPCTCDGCGRRSSVTRPARSGWSRCGASATGGRRRRERPGRQIVLIAAAWAGGVGLLGGVVAWLHAPPVAAPADHRRRRGRRGRGRGRDARDRQRDVPLRPRLRGRLCSCRSSRE